MKLMKRNLVSIQYCLYRKTEPILDDDGNETSEYKIVYGSPVELSCNVSVAKGYSQVNMFGSSDGYDKVIITDDMDCPIDENSVLFVDKKASFKDGNPQYDYTVKRVAKSFNSIAYAISKVKVS